MTPKLRLKELEAEVETQKDNPAHRVTAIVYLQGYKLALEDLKPVLEAAIEVLDTPSRSRLPKQLEARQ